MDGEVRVRKSSSPADFRKFLALPWNIYRNDSNWIPPLESDIREKVDRRENPFYEHADREILLAFRGQEPVGRVVAILDHSHNSFHEEKNRPPGKTRAGPASWKNGTAAGSSSSSISPSPATDKWL